MSLKRPASRAGYLRVAVLIFGITKPHIRTSKSSSCAGCPILPAVSSREGWESTDRNPPSLLNLQSRFALAGRCGEDESLTKRRLPKITLFGRTLYTANRQNLALLRSESCATSP